MNAHREQINDASDKKAVSTATSDTLSSARTESISGIGSLSKTDESSKPAVKGDTLDLGDKNWMDTLNKAGTSGPCTIEEAQAAKTAKLDPTLAKAETGSEIPFKTNTLYKGILADGITDVPPKMRDLTATGLTDVQINRGKADVLTSELPRQKIERGGKDIANTGSIKTDIAESPRQPGPKGPADVAAKEGPRSSNPNSYTQDRRDWDKIVEVNSNISANDIEFYNFDDPGMKTDSREFLASNTTRSVKLEFSTSMSEISEKLLGPGASAQDVQALTDKMLKLNGMTDGNAELKAGQELILVSRDRTAGGGTRSLEPAVLKPGDKPAVVKGDEPGAVVKGEKPGDTPVVKGDKPVDKPVDKPADKEYTVQKGDSLWKIVKRELPPGASNQDIHKRVQEIAKANKLRNPNLIHPGQVLKMPGKPGDAPADKPGDNPVKPPSKPITEDPGDKPGDKPGVKPGDRPGELPGDNPGDKPGIKPPGEPVPEEPGDKPGEKPGKKPGEKPGEIPGEKPGDKPTVPGEKPGDKPTVPGEKPGDKPVVPGEKPGEKPGGDRPLEKPGDPGKPLTERERLEKNAEKAFKDQPDKLKRFKENMKEFEERAQREKLPPGEVDKTYKEVNRLLEAKGDTPLKQSDRARLADQVVRQAANPRGIDQGQHNTCAINTVEVKTYTNHPSDAAKMVADVATTGQYTARDGKTVKVDPTPHDESKWSDGPPNRTHASEIFQVTAANINLQHQLARPDAIPKGDLRYEQTDKIPGNLQSGERLMDYSTNPPTYKGDGPNVHTANIGTLGDTYKSITGDDPKETILGHDKKITDKSENVKRVKSEAELNDFLAKAKAEGKFPIQVSVETGNEPFWTDSGGGSAGGSGGGHVVTIQDYIPGPPPKVTLDNSWGPMADHDARTAISVHDLHTAMQFPRDSIKEVQKDIDASRADGKPDHYKEFDVLRIERGNQKVTADKDPAGAAKEDTKYADKLIDAMKRAKDDWDKGKNPEDRERSLKKLNDLIRAMDQPNRDRVMAEQKKLGLDK